MFSGIVEQKARVAAVEPNARGARLVLAAELPGARPGQSLAVNGCCLTIVTSDGGRVVLDVVPETLSRTNLGMLAAGDWVHLERSLRLGDSVDGHFVQGHVDGRAELVARDGRGGEARLTVRPPAGMMKYVAPKGAVTLDGVSLTVANINGDTFEVALIPTTLDLTALGERPIGWPLNFEADVLSKTVVNWLERRSGADNEDGK